MKNERQQPAIRTPEHIDVPAAAMSAAPNGVKIYTLDCSDQDVIRFSFVFRAGSSLQDAPFSASATANMLSEGSTLRPAQEIAEALDFHGSYYDVALDRDYAVINFVSLLKHFERTLEIAREIVLMPAFDERELATYCAKHKQRLAVERSRPSFRVRELFTSALFGAEHPYGVSYPEERYDDLRREHLAEFYRRHYTAADCFVVCSGKVAPEHTQMIAQLAAGLPEGTPYTAPEFRATESERFVFSPYPDAVQSSIRTGRLLFPRTHPDFVTMQVLSTVLGGYFGSRLVRNLREEHGYTYGAFSSVVNLEYSGYLAIATEVAAEVTQDAVAQIFAEITRLHTEPVPDEELQMVKKIMAGEVMRILDGPFGIADVTIENIQNGTDNTYLDRWLEEVRAMTPERLLSAAQRYLDPDGFTTVIVGNPALEEVFK
ncbi:insulinase family protein [Alistipes sp. OttesenSCG-928-B03]|nr:insulinase family protein [Alistipes sp. OttesenSCG-928-B03]